MILKIPLSQAYFCENCQSITNSANLCHCGATNLVHIARWLNRISSPENQKRD